MKQADIPKTPDGAKVLSVTVAESGLGAAGTRDGEKVAIVGLAVAQFENSRGVYLFACDSEWNVVGDLFYEGMREAKEGAERFYETSANFAE